VLMSCSFESKSIAPGVTSGLALPLDPLGFVSSFVLIDFGFLANFFFGFDFTRDHSLTLQ